MSLPEIFAHRWMMRPSQITHKGPSVIADKLTENLRQSGDLEMASPEVINNTYVVVVCLLHSGYLYTLFSSDIDQDADVTMQPGGYQSQFTQNLQLFVSDFVHFF